MKIVSIINLKGGVGKTFTAIQMGHLLATSGCKVLLFDNDKQGNLSKFYQVYENTDTCGAAAALGQEFPQLDNIKKATKYAQQDIIPANMSLLTATLEVTKTTAADQHLRYARIMQQAAAAGYDYVIFDNPPDIGLNVINALMVTDDVIVPTKIDEWAIEGLEVITEQVQAAKQINPRIRMAGALITNYRNNDTNISGVEWLQAMNYKTFKTKIRHSDKAAESTFFHAAAQEYSPRSAVAMDYKLFIAEYVESWCNI